MNADSNPYAPPCDNSPGEYKWPLAKQIFLACSALAIVYMLCGAVASWQAFQSVTPYEASLSERLSGFFSDWKAPQEVIR